MTHGGKKCEACGKLISSRSISGLCREHFNEVTFRNGKKQTINPIEKGKFLALFRQKVKEVPDINLLPKLKFEYSGFPGGFLKDRERIKQERLKRKEILGKYGKS